MLYTHAIDLDYLSAQLAAQYGPLTRTGSLEWLAGLPAAPTLRGHGRQRTQPDYQLRQL